MNKVALIQVMKDMDNESFKHLLTDSRAKKVFRKKIKLKESTEA